MPDGTASAASYITPRDTVLLILPPAFDLGFAHALGECGIIEAKRMLNAVIRAKEFLSFHNRLSAILARPE